MYMQVLLPLLLHPSPFLLSLPPPLSLHLPPCPRPRPPLSLLLSPSSTLPPPLSPSSSLLYSSPCLHPAITELNRLQRFRLQLRTSWFQHNLPETPTVWPMKHEIDPRPLVVSNVRVFPLETNAPSLQGNVRMQLQLYGNKQGA